MTLADILLCALAAFAGGAVNAVAGGGTFLTFPLLIFSGMSALSANILSTIALWPGSVASAFAYRAQVYRDAEAVAALREFIKNTIFISIIGSGLGVWLLLAFPERVFEGLVPWLLLFATIVFALGKRIPLWVSHSGQPHRLAYALQFCVAVYGGYFGAGIGILMLAILQLLGFVHIHQMNALKTILGSSINAVAVIIFIASGKVMWALAPFLIAGGIAGGYVGAKLALKISPEKVRVAIVITGLCVTAYFFARAF